MNLSYETPIKPQDFGVVGRKEAWREVTMAAKEGLKASFLPHVSVKHGFPSEKPKFPNGMIRILDLELVV